MSKQLDKKGKAVLTQIQSSHEVRYQGPVPPPEIMERMDQVLPGAADRIFKMAEADQQSQIERIRSIEARADRLEQHNHSENIAALWMAFICCISLAGMGTYLIANNHVITGGLMIGSTIVGVVGSFLNRKKTRQE